MNLDTFSRNVVVGLWLIANLSVNQQTAAFTIESSRRIPTETTALRNSGLSDWSSRAGDSALRQVQFLASQVAASTAASEGDRRIARNKKSKKGTSKAVQGIGGVVFNNPEYNRNMENMELSSRLMDDTDTGILNSNEELRTGDKREDQVWVALANLEVDSK